jgi:hypothetical protein
MFSMKNASKLNFKLLSFYRNVSIAILFSIFADIFLGFLLSNSVITPSIFGVGLSIVWAVLGTIVIWSIKTRIIKPKHTLS